jgi:hypothetical protein
MFLPFDLFLQTTTLLQKLLRPFLIFPEARSRGLAFDLLQLFPLRSNIKETSRVVLRVGAIPRKRFSNLELISFHPS